MTQGKILINPLLYVKKILSYTYILYSLGLFTI